MNEQEIRRIVEEAVAGGSTMTLAKAEKLCDAVLEEASRMGVRAVVCVSDGAGNPKIVKVADDAYIASYDVAIGKAFTVVALKMSTSKLSTLAQPGGELYGIQFTNGGRIVIFGGGDPLTDRGGRVIGGLGVSGGSEAQDAALSDFGKRYFESNLL
jgi:uncharacterized protein GlcG (DUF336 family)